MSFKLFIETIVKTHSSSHLISESIAVAHSTIDFDDINKADLAYNKLKGVTSQGSETRVVTKLY